MSYTRNAFLSLACAGVLMLLATLTQAATRYVPSQYATIQAAITAATAGDTIVVAAGIYRESLVWTDKDLILHGAGEGVSILDPSAANGGPGGRCLYTRYLTPASRMDRFTLQNGNANGTNDAAGMHNDFSNPTVTDCTFLQGIAANQGSGIWNYQSSPTVTNCTFSGNRAAQGAGMLNTHSSEPTVTNCYFSQNTASNNGGGMLNDDSSHPAVTDCIFIHNRGPFGGGMGNSDFSHATLTNCNFIQNEGVEGGGGLYNIDSNPTVMGCEFNGNTLLAGNRNGGGMLNHSCNPTVTHCTFIENAASNGRGGGMNNNDDSAPIVTHCTFTQNAALNGGGMYNSDDSRPTVRYCTFRENAAILYGGGMDNFFAASPTVTDCTFIRNTAGYGAGMRSDHSFPTVTNCLFTQNAASNSGGGMLNDGNNPLLTHCTFTLNTAGNLGGGICNATNTATLTNCILWGNTAFVYPGIYGSAIIAYSNVQDRFSATPNASGNFTANPRFVDGPNGNLRLMSDSPCINRGTAAAPNLPAADLEGNPRIVGIAPDLGVYEYQGVATATVSGTVTLESCVNAAQTLTFEFRPADNSGNFTRTVALSATGAFLLSDLPQKSYTVRIKGAKWLARTVPVNTSNGNVNNLSAMLRSGDANQDNSVDALDLAVLITAFNTAPGDEMFDSAADFNCDDSVDALDLALLITNFNTEGDS